MIEKELIKQIKNAVLTVFNNTGFIKIIKIKENSAIGAPKRLFDLLIEVQTGDRTKYALVFEIKTEGQPKYARIAISQLKEIISNNINYYGVFASTFISDETRRICQENNTGFIDTAGNCFFNFDNVFFKC